MMPVQYNRKDLGLRKTLTTGLFGAEGINPDTDRVAYAWQRVPALRVANWYRTSQPSSNET